MENKYVMETMIKLDEPQDATCSRLAVCISVQAGQHVYNAVDEARNTR